MGIYENIGNQKKTKTTNQKNQSACTSYSAYSLYSVYGVQAVLLLVSYDHNRALQSLVVHEVEVVPVKIFP